MRLSLRLIWLAALAAVIVGSLAPAQSGVMHLIDQGGINDKVEHFTAYVSPRRPPQSAPLPLPHWRGHGLALPLPLPPGRRTGTGSAGHPGPNQRLARPPGEHLRYPGRSGPGAHSPEVYSQFSSQWTTLTTSPITTSNATTSA